MVGKLHKKKISEYTDAADNDGKHYSDKSDDDAGDDCMIDKEDLASGSESENGDVANNKLNKSTESADINDDDDDETVLNDDDEDIIKGQHDESNEGMADDVPNLSVDDAGDFDDDDGANKKTKKRKMGDKAKKDGDVSDGENMNGVTPKKRGRKALPKTGVGKAAAAAKGVAKAKAKKAKKPAASADEEEEDEEEYEVKDIVGHKTERGVSYFLIRWKGYTKADDTWEAENTLSCPEIIDRYKKKNTTVTPKKGAAPAKKGKTPVAKKAAGGKKEDNEQEWEVDKIIDYAEEKKGRVFRIRWKGFGPKHDTWEPEENLNCGDIIDKFLKRMKSQENVSFKELREEPKKTKRLSNETLPRTNLSNRIGRTSKRSVTKKSSPSPEPPKKSVALGTNANSKALSLDTTNYSLRRSLTGKNPDTSSSTALKNGNNSGKPVSLLPLKYQSVVANWDRMLQKLPDDIIEDVNYDIITFLYKKIKSYGP